MKEGEAEWRSVRGERKRGVDWEGLGVDWEVSGER